VDLWIGNKIQRLVGGLRIAVSTVIWRVEAGLRQLLNFNHNISSDCLTLDLQKLLARDDVADSIFLTFCNQEEGELALAKEEASP